ncbi:MAG: hypothetical protein ACI8W9_000881, partial [Psychromonas sp.]
FCLCGTSTLQGHYLAPDTRKSILISSNISRRSAAVNPHSYCRAII